MRNPPDMHCGYPSVGEAFECLGLSWAGVADDLKSKSAWESLAPYHRTVYMTVSIALVVTVIAMIVLVGSWLVTRAGKRTSASSAGRSAPR